MMIGHQGILAAMRSAGGGTKTIFGAFPNGSPLIVNSTVVPRSFGLAGQTQATTTASRGRTGVAGEFTDLQVTYWTTTTSGGAGTAIELADATLGDTYAVVIPSGSTGYPALSVATQATTASQEWQWFGINGTGVSGALTLHGLTASFVGSAGQHVQLWGGNITSSNAFASTTRYMLVAGTIQYRSAIAQAELRFTAAGTIVEWSVYVLTNGRSTDTTFQLLVNGVVVSSAVVPGGGTGLYGSTTPAAVSVNDLVCLATVTGTGTGSVTTQAATLSCVMAGLTSDLWVYGGSALAASGTTVYWPILSVGSSSATLNASPTTAGCRLNFAAALQIPQVYVQTNSATVATTLTLMVNGGASGVSVTIPAGTTGWVTGTGSVTVAATDVVAWRAAVAGGSGTIGPMHVGIQIEYLSG